MSEFEDKLNAILSSPEQMQQVAQLAKMLSNQSGGGESDKANNTPPPPPQEPTTPPSNTASSSPPGDIDLSMLSRFLPLLQEMQQDSNNERAQLLYALKPFLKPERQTKIDSALRLARLFRAGKSLFKGLGEHHV